MSLVKFNNKRVTIVDVNDRVYRGICLYENKEEFEEEYDALSIKDGFRWVKIFENEIKEIKTTE